MDALSLQGEEQIVGELARLGVRYLSRMNSDVPVTPHKPHDLLAKLACQPSSRVRTALVALFLARPDYAEYIFQALNGLLPKDAQTLRFFYTAAVYLQQKNEPALKAILGERWCKLPDWFSNELGITGNSPATCLRELASIQAQVSGEYLNWAGTYENAAQHLLRRWEHEQIWKA